MKQQMLEVEVKELKARIESLVAELVAVKEAYGDVEQYARRHCAEVESLTAERDRLRAIGTEMAESIEGNYYLPGVATRWRAAQKGETP
jgi:hypothetical protein